MPDGGTAGTRQLDSPRSVGLIVINHHAANALPQCARNKSHIEVATGSRRQAAAVVRLGELSGGDTEKCSRSSRPHRTRQRWRREVHRGGALVRHRDRLRRAHGSKRLAGEIDGGGRKCKQGSPSGERNCLRTCAITISDRKRTETWSCYRRPESQPDRATSSWRQSGATGI